MNQQLGELWRARHFIRTSIRNEFVSRVVRSRLGFLWIVLYPLAQVAIYAFVLSIVMAAKLPGLTTAYAYPIYLTAGILAWSLFAEIVSRSLNLYIENGNLLKKVVFPKLALPAIMTGSALLNNLLLLAAVLVIFAFLGHLPGAAIVWLPILMALLLVLALGVGLLLGLLNVFIRDIGQIVSIVLQFGFWLTPIVYNLELLSERYRHLLYLNPLTGIVQGYQDVLLYRQAPDLGVLIYPATCAAVSVVLAVWVYRRGIDDVVDVL
ncbi:ABC transporter permease [Stutzerimonas urumqiensis]|uniref:ABC transporter permease n=1 Tax=Stutzerimonas urumqiensis TaxID=638269 RepID=UPI000EB0DA59|nr:ABC transporter permease [Stutzerimonas urumqiensis]